VFTLKIKEKNPRKEKSNSKSILTLKRGLTVKIVRSMAEDFLKRLESFFSRGENGRKTKREKKCVEEKDGLLFIH